MTWGKVNKTNAILQRLRKLQVWKSAGEPYDVMPNRQIWASAGDTNVCICE